VRLQLAEDTVRVGDSGPWRRIVLRTANGHQTPILTSLDATTLAAGRVTMLMLARWRQENFFKYARAHLGLDVLTTYAADTAADREVPNPAVKAATAELKRLRTTAQKLRAAVGQALMLDIAPPPDQPAQSTQTVREPVAGVEQPTEIREQPTAPPKRTRRVPPATRDALIAQLRAIEEQIEQTRAHARGLPARVLLSTQGALPQAPELETKLIADVVKIAAYNAQSWLADRVAHHDLNRNDLHDLLRSFAHLAGTITRQPDGGLMICLEPPDTPLDRRALASLCAELSQARPVLPGTTIPVQYAVAEPR
jgi:hypothetical protein